MIRQNNAISTLPIERKASKALKLKKDDLMGWESCVASW